MNFLLKISRGIDAFTDFIGNHVTDYIVILVIIVGFYNVFVRYLGRFIELQLSSNVYIELQWYLFSMIFCLGFAYVLKHNVNVRVDFLYANWSERTRAWVDFVGTLIFLIPFCILGIYVAIVPVSFSWGFLPDGSWGGSIEMSPDANGLPRAPIKSMIIVAFALLLLQAISQAIKYAAIISGHVEIAKQIAAETEVTAVE
ncbi:MAG: TRAP transporter small permease subunit [Chloroflexi bacterium]|nr:TRAP transporter small permease subunit [Chloroflexota bacterium]MBI5712436.1 TRAP transporter small permease subunit [Chloroflexota bacterium]